MCRLVGWYVRDGKRGESPMHVSVIEGREGGGCLFLSGLLTL